MNRIICLFKNYFPVFLLGIILIVFFLPFYREGRMIAGGEGSYLFDFSMVLKNYGYSWSNSGTGIIATSLNFGYVFPLIFLQKLFSDERIVNFIMIYSLYFLPFLAVYLLSLELKLKPWIAFLIALFYITNPFTANFLKSINQWNMLAAYIIPTFLWLILKFYDNSRKLFFFFGIHSLFFAFTNANPPTMILYQIAIVIFILFVSLYRERKFNFKTIVGKYFLVLSSFLLFNMWWILNWFSILPDVQQGYTKTFVVSWLEGAKMFNPAFWRVFTLTGLIQYPINPQYDYFTKYYSYSIVSVLLLIPVTIFAISLLKKKVLRTYHFFIILMLLASGFLSKGVNDPFGGIYEFLVRYLPFFSIFKSADEKWGLLFTFFLTLFLILILRDLKKEKFYKFILSLMMIYVGYNLIPFVTSNFIPDYKFNQHLAGSRKFLDKVEYQNLKKDLDNDREQYRVLSLPGSLNYQVALRIEGNRFYTGNDPILSNTNKSFIAPYNGTFSQTFPILFDSISSQKYLNLLSLFNIKKIAINKDMYPWFGFREKENITQLERIFDKKLKSDKNSLIDLYDLGDYYLPRFYIPKKTIYSKGSIDNLMDIVSFDDYKTRSGIYLDTINGLTDSKINELEELKNRADEVFVKAELENPVDKNYSQNLEGFKNSVPFPYAKYEQGSFLYPLVLKKEEFEEWKVRKDPEKLIDKKLYYAGKRISEFEKFGTDNADETLTTRIIGGYQDKMEEAIEELKRFRDLDKQKEMIIKMRVYWERHKEKIEEIYKDKLEGVPSDNDWESVFKELDTEIGTLEKPFDLRNLTYNFEIPKKGTYSIFINNIEGLMNLGMNGNTIEINRDKIEINGGWIKLGEREFEGGNPKLILHLPEPDNLVGTNWQKFEETKVKEWGVEFTQNPFPDVKNLVFQEINNWQSDNFYSVSFDYTTKESHLGVGIMESKTELKEENNVVKKEKVLSRILINGKNDERQTFETILKADKKTLGAEIYFYIPANSNNSGKVEFKNLKVERIYQPEIILRNDIGNQKLDIERTNIQYPVSNIQHQVPKITFVKINPTKYRVKVEGAKDPYTLIFSESFHERWKAYINELTDSKINGLTDYGEVVASYFDGEIKEGTHKNIFLDGNTFETWGKKPISEDKHLLVNGYANSWYITPQDSGNRENYEIIIEFWPQRLFYVGLVISLATLFGCLGYLGYSFIRRKFGKP